MCRRIERLDKSALRDTVVRMGERNASAGALSILMLALMWPGPAGAQPATQPTQTFTSSANGYSIEFPADWTQVPDADVQRLVQVMHKAAPTVNVTWEAVYQAPGGRRSFHYPYVVVQVIPYQADRQLREDEIEATVKQMTGSQLKKLSNNTTGVKAFDQAMQSASFGVAQYDATNHIYYLSVNGNAAGVGPINGSTIGHFGAHALVTVMCYDEARNAQDSKATFDQIQSSFHFDPASAYDPSQNSMLARVLGGAGRGALIGAFVGLLVAGIWAVTRRRKTPARRF